MFDLAEVSVGIGSCNIASMLFQDGESLDEIATIGRRISLLYISITLRINSKTEEDVHLIETKFFGDSKARSD